MAEAAQWAAGNGRTDKVHFLRGQMRTMPPHANDVVPKVFVVGVDELRQLGRPVCKTCLKKMGLSSEFLNDV